MTSRERMLTVLANGRPDRLPCQVHNWMPYYLERTLGGIDAWAAYERFGMDYALYLTPEYRFAAGAWERWQTRRDAQWADASGNQCWRETILTPKGELHGAWGMNAITCWNTEPLVKTPADFELWREFFPDPVGVDFTAMRAARARLGDRGIIRTYPYCYGQLSPWQCFCTLADTQPAIMWALTEPEFVHHALEAILQKILRGFAVWAGAPGGNPADLVETGGGAGSNTVISPDLHREFCLPYDRREHAAVRELGLKSVYHLCGGVMRLLEIVAENGADGLETMTPAAMGGDCDLREASRRVGARLFFVGGFDQNAGFEHGTPERARQLVYECFAATKDHAGYIVSPSDHFFTGDPACLRAFAAAARECVYD
jgi:uroporphyrinogen-III decarboxylase